MEQQSQEQNALYSPLEPGLRQTRLFTLLPGVHGDPIKGFLTQVLLDRDPEYEALSYVWGDPTVTVPIYLTKDGLNVATCVEFGVTTNLESALRHLRWKDSPRRLWIDAICINQSDTLERNHQVQNMRWVYRAASGVIAWLGKATIYSHRGLKMLSDLMTSDQLVNVFDTSKDHGFSLAQHCFRDIAYRDYWQRIWIVQEIALAKIIRLVCGPFSVEILAGGGSDQMIRNLQGLEKSFFWEAGFSMSRLISILRLREMGLAFRILSLWGLVWQFRHSKSHDPRDMVFALLGLVSESEIMEENTADYALTMSQVSSRLLHSYISRYGNLNILNYLDELFNSKDDPEINHSEKPDVDGAWEELQAIRFVPLNSSITSRFREFNASKNSHPIVRLGSNKDFRLIMQGFLVGDIDYIGRRYQYNPLNSKSIAITSTGGFDMSVLKGVYARDSTLDKKTNNLYGRLVSHRIIISEWKDQSISLSQIKPSPQNPRAGSKDLILEAFWRTIVADSVSLEELSGVQKMFLAPQQTLHGHKPSQSSRFGQMVEILTNDRLAKDLERPLDGKLPGTSAPAFNYFARAVEVAVGRRQFFINNTGRMGLAPTSAVEGDTICILFGGTTPFVLRPVGKDRYQLVGECYVHGMMDGEAMEDLNKGVYTKKEITLV